MKVTLSQPLRQAMPEMTVHLLLARGIQLEVLRYFQAAPPALDATEVESLIVRWRGFYRGCFAPPQVQGPLEVLLRCGMNQCYPPVLPLLEMARYASLVSQAPLTAYAASRLAGAMTLTLAQAVAAEATPALSPAEPVWLDGQQRLVCRSLNLLLSAADQPEAQTDSILFVSEQPTADFPSPAHGMHYLSATLQPLCRSLHAAVLNRQHGDVTL